MKKLQDIIGNLYESAWDSDNGLDPKSGDERKFKDKHTITKFNNMYSGSDYDDLFQGSTKFIDRPSERHGYNPKQDAKLYASYEPEGDLVEAAWDRDLEDHEPRTVHGVKGVNSKKFKKKFKNQAAQDKFFDHPDREGDYEITHVMKEGVNENMLRRAARKIQRMMPVNPSKKASMPGGKWQIDVPDPNPLSPFKISRRSDEANKLKARIDMTKRLRDAERDSPFAGRQNDRAGTRYKAQVAADRKAGLFNQDDIESMDHDKEFGRRVKKRNLSSRNYHNRMLTRDRKSLKKLETSSYEPSDDDLVAESRFSAYSQQISKDSGLKDSEYTGQFNKIEELSKKTLASYIDQATMNLRHREHRDGYDQGREYPREGEKGGRRSQARLDQMRRDGKKNANRAYSIGLAARKLAREEDEYTGQFSKIEELSKKTLASYIDNATMDLRHREHRDGFDQGREYPREGEKGKRRSQARLDQMRRDSKKNANRAYNIGLAARKLAREEAEELDEMAQGMFRANLYGYNNQSENDGYKYKIRRHYKKGGAKTIASGVSKSFAQSHCQHPETSSSTATSKTAKAHTRRHGEWFDGYYRT